MAQRGSLLGMDDIQDTSNDLQDTSTENSGSSEAEISIPENVFLIFQGVKAIPLNKPVVSIGRSHDNTVVIDDPRISRHHVEVRVINDRFVVFDLHSTGGTFVNGQRVNEGLLYPGDLISLAGVNLVFIQDRQLQERSKGDTNPIGPGVHSTAIFHSSMTDKDIKRKYP
jgi:pSer/pThr/pTyr-binding forkhead associated (FHA) protein